VDPLVGLALAHAKQAPLHHLEAVRLHIRENKQQPILRSRQGTVLVHAETAGGAGFAIETPRGHMGLEGRLKGRDQLLELVEREPGQIEELCGVVPHVRELYMCHEWCLL
jgi:hypothetical protein